MAGHPYRINSFTFSSFSNLSLFLSFLLSSLSLLLVSAFLPSFQSRHTTSSHIRDEIAGPKWHSKTKISTNEENFVPITMFSSVFHNSLLLFRGDTSIFQFKLVNAIGVPFLQISHDYNQSFEIDIYKLIESRNLLRTISKSVRQQIITVGISNKSRYRHKNTPFAHSEESRTVIPVYPQVLIAISTVNRGVKDNIGYLRGGGLFAVFALNGPVMSFLFMYNSVNQTPAEAFLICHHCQHKGHMEESFVPVVRTVEKKHPPEFSVKFQWRGSDVDAEMKKVRKNMTDDGRNILWQLPQNFINKFPSPVAFVQGGEILAQEFSMGSKISLLGMEKLEIAVVKVLFPLHVSTYSATCGLLTNCISVNRCKMDNRLIPCANRGVIKPRVMPYEFASLTFKSLDLVDNDVVFITSEKVRHSKNDSTAQLFVGVFDSTVWILLCVCATMASIVYALIDFKATQRPGKAGWTNLDAITAYFGCSLIEQFPRDLPVTGQIIFSGHPVKSQVILFLWAIGTIFLRNWYTAFMKSSFNFPFPYELSMTGWRDFENFSLYLLGDANTFQVKEKKLDGRWDFDYFRDRLLEDVGNFDNSSWDDPSIKTFYIPVHNGIIPSQFYLQPSKICVKSGSMFRPGTSLRSGSNDYPPILNWIVGKRCSAHLCLLNYQESNNSRDSSTKCSKDQKVLMRMHYRLDMIDYKKLNVYVGQWYENLTHEGRDIGLQLIEQLGNQTVPKNDKDYFKQNYVFRYENGGYGNTFYWMTRRPEAAFVTTKAEFPWHWNQFKKLMKKDRSLRFAHTGSKTLNSARTNRGLGGMNGVVPVFQIQGPQNKHMPEWDWMKRRISALAHSGILNFMTKWNLILRPPTDEKLNEFIEETDTGFQALTMQHDSVKATFTLKLWLLGISCTLFLFEISVHAMVV